jgi:hypothetical protein
MGCARESSLRGWVDYLTPHDALALTANPQPARRIIPPPNSPAREQEQASSYGHVCYLQAYRGISMI